MSTEAPPKATPTTQTQLDRVTIRFAGDSGDGMQLTGTQFTRNAAAFGNDISTFPDYPAEIRAPAGSLPGVSGFQLSFSSTDIHTPGDAPDVLVAMNPAALKANLGELPAGGALIVNEDAFTPQNLAKVGYATNPLSDGSLKQWNVFSVPISTLNSRALEGLGLTNKQVDLTKNFFALGLMFWLYERDMAAHGHLDRREVLEAARRSPRATSAPSRPATTSARRPRSSTSGTSSRRPSSRPGTYRNITGNEATALGFVAASQLADRALFYGSYPITPASDILHQLAGYKNFGVKTFQAEDEIAAIGAAIGASYGGAMGLTASSGPGHRPQERGPRARRHGRAAARRRRRPARRPLDRACPPRPSRRDLLQVMFGRNSRLAACRRRAGDARASASTSRSRRGGSRSST